MDNHSGLLLRVLRHKVWVEQGGLPINRLPDIPAPPGSHELSVTTSSDSVHATDGLRLWSCNLNRREWTAVNLPTKAAWGSSLGTWKDRPVLVAPALAKKNNRWRSLVWGLNDRRWEEGPSVPATVIKEMLTDTPKGLYINGNPGFVLVQKPRTKWVPFRGTGFSADTNHIVHYNGRVYAVGRGDTDPGASVKVMEEGAKEWLCCGTRGDPEQPSCFSKNECWLDRAGKIWMPRGASHLSVKQADPGLYTCYDLERGQWTGETIRCLSPVCHSYAAAF